MRLGDACLQFVLGQGLGVIFDLAVAGRLEGIDRGLADAFQQQDPDVLFRVRGFREGHARLSDPGRGR